jgi:hypothetical protein
MGWFRKAAQTEPLAVTMAGVKLGDRFLAIGVRDIPLIAALAVKAGLTGQAWAVESDEALAARGRVEIEREGALVDVMRAPWGMWPLDAGSVDVAVIANLMMSLHSGTRGLCMTETLRVLRPGGRVVVIEPARRAGFGALLHRDTIDRGYAGPARTLKDAGFAAVRELAETDGVVYAEGIKKA